VVSHLSGHRRHNGLRHVSPGQWHRVVLRTAQDLWSVNVLEWASSIAFYGFISTFPLIIAILIIVSSVADASSVAHHTTTILKTFIPEGGPEAGHILESAVAERRRIGLLSLGIFFVSGRRVLGVLTKALNQVSDVQRRDDSLMRRVAVELALLVGLVIFGLLALLAKPLLIVLWDTARFLPGPDAPTVRALSVVLRAIPIMATFALVYAFVPYGERLWRAVLVGAGAATVLLLLVRRLFDMFADRIWTNMGLLYGPLALAAVLLSWLWCVAVITLVGGGFASHVKTMILEHRSEEQTHHQHVEG
jgi:membrane protein